MLGPPVERLEEGYQVFSVVYFSRGTLAQKRNGKRALLKNLVWLAWKLPVQVNAFRIRPLRLSAPGLIGRSLPGRIDRVPGGNQADPSKREAVPEFVQPNSEIGLKGKPWLGDE